jgi:hypothetical protein
LSGPSEGNYGNGRIDLSGPNKSQTILHELQHYIQELEGFTPGSNPDFGWKRSQVEPMAKKLYERPAVPETDPDLVQLLKDFGYTEPDKSIPWNDLPMREKVQWFEPARSKLYHNTAGEVEARNVPRRMNMTPEELKATYPWETQDVPDVEHILNPPIVGSSKSVEQAKNVAADYQGEHGAPMKDSGSPLYNVTGVYPKDFYSGKGFQYYADLGSEKNMDLSSYGTINSYLGMPDRPITVYRAVPKDPDIKGINKGDWVTINRDYAKEHGQGALNGDYKILKKQVYARDLFTAGDSHHEWGYDPQPTSGLKREDKAAIRKDVRGYEKGGSVEDRALMLVSRQA